MNLEEQNILIWLRLLIVDNWSLRLRQIKMLSSTSHNNRLFHFWVANFYRGLYGGGGGGGGGKFVLPTIQFSVTIRGSAKV